MGQSTLIGLAADGLFWDVSGCVGNDLIGYTANIISHLPDTMTASTKPLRYLIRPSPNPPNPPNPHHLPRHLTRLTHKTGRLLMSPQLAPKLRGIERADSIAFDFHKWMQVPYDAGFILVRDGALHHDTFAQPTTYLRRDTRGAAAGSPWPCDFGPDLSRGFRALKTWMTIKTYGVERLGQVMAATYDLAQYLLNEIQACPKLELMAPVNLNIVCFRYRPLKSDDSGRHRELDLAALNAMNAMNAELIIQLHESGIALPSATTLGGQLVMRAALFNH